MTSTSAPGKLFLLGEYAVLDGAPALLTAVNCRAQVQLRPHGQWQLTAPDLDLFNQPLAPPHGAATAHKLRVVNAVVDAVLKTARGQQLTPQAIHITSQEFMHRGHKLGLGSSAAVAAALAGALCPQLNKAELTDLAIHAHRQAQGGTGSGADIATSIYGGVLQFAGGQVLQTLAWPKDLTLLAVPTGKGASTPTLVGRVKQFQQAQPRLYQRIIENLAELAHQAPSALHNPADFLTLAKAYFEGLKALDKHAQAGIILPLHLQLAEWVEALGGVFKTTGAGGGDLGLILAPSPDIAQRISQALAAQGHNTIKLDLAAPGLAQESGSLKD